MWTIKNRPRYNRDKLRYPSDLTDAEWVQIELLIPPAKRGGGKRRVDMRDVVNGIMYVLSTGCQWRYIPKDLPPRSTVNEYFCLWSHNGTLERIHDALYVKCREQAEREASPTACIIDSQRLSDPEQFTFDTIISQIILGPSLSSPLARASVIQMLKVMGKPLLIPKVISSTIPLRPS